MNTCLLINAAFDQVIRSLVALQKHRQFHRDELARFRRHAKETRASLETRIWCYRRIGRNRRSRTTFPRPLAQEKNDEGEADSGGLVDRQMRFLPLAGLWG